MFWLVSPWDTNIPITVATLSAYRTHLIGCNVMALTGISTPAFVIFGLRQYAGWIKHECTLVDPYDSKQTAHDIYQRD